MKDIVQFCKLYHASTYVPISAYNSEGERICAFSLLPEEIDVNQALLPKLRQPMPSPYIFFSEAFGYYGIIHIPETDDRLVIGPAYNTPITTEIINSFMKECVLADELKDSIAQFLSSTPRISYYHFIQMLEFVYFFLFDKTLPEGSLDFSYLDRAPKDISQKATHLSYESKEEQTLHNSYNYEKRILKIIAEGKTQALRQFMSEYVSHEPLTEGVLANSPLRQAKNIFIGWATLVGKVAAIEGGLDVEQTYSLIDVYIQECERAFTLEEISRLHYYMLLDFATRVERCHITADISPLTFACIQYINGHVNESLHIDDVAQHVGKSRSYLVDVFKKEMGVNLGEYIVQCKLNEAQSLLLYTDKTMSEISNYLCFSSQSYFISVFKKAFAITPKQFQMKHKPFEQR